jgi:hypothetical protein
LEYRRKKEMEDTENYKVEDDRMIGGRRWKKGGAGSLRMEGVRKGDMLHGGGREGWEGVLCSASLVPHRQRARHSHTTTGKQSRGKCSEFHLEEHLVPNIENAYGTAYYTVNRLHQDPADS